MKNSHIFSILTVTILLILITPTVVQSQMFSQNLVLATTQEDQDDSTSSSDENNDSSGDKQVSGTSQVTTDTEDTQESNSDEENNNEVSSSPNQTNECPDSGNLSNVPTYIGEDGCRYPCRSADSVGQDGIPKGCPVELPSQTSTGFSIIEEQRLQPQPNFDSKSPQKTLTGPKTDSDATATMTNTPNTETTTKSFSPTGQFKPGSGQKNSDFPPFSFDPSKPYFYNFSPPIRQGAAILDTNPETSFAPGEGQSTSDISSPSNNPDGPLTPGSGNVKRQGSSLEPKAHTELSNPIQSSNPAGLFKPGSKQAESTIPNDSVSLTGSLTPGVGNAQTEGIANQSDTNPLTPLDSENIPSKIEDKLAYLSVYSESNSNKPVEICVFTSNPNEVEGNPYCIEASPSGTLHALQAPGLIGIRTSGNVDYIDTSNCEFPIYPKESKSCVLKITDSPLIKSKSETTKQDRTLSFNR